MIELIKELDLKKEALKLQKYNYKQEISMNNKSDIIDKIRYAYENSNDEEAGIEQNKRK